MRALGLVAHVWGQILLLHSLQNKGHSMHVHDLEGRKDARAPEKTGSGSQSS